MQTIRADLNKDLQLGKQGTGGTRQIIFDVVREWLNAYPNGVITLFHRRSGDSDAMPVSTFAVAESVGVWVISEADTWYDDCGEAELVMTEDGKKAKSKTYPTFVIKALTHGDQPPEPHQGWYENLIEAAEQIQTAVAHAPVIGENGNWFVWDANISEYVDSEQPSHGADGVSPTASIRRVTDGVEITITDAEGTHTGIILDGEDGTDGSDGIDGYSPAVTVSSVSGGHTVTITDKDHPDGQTFTVTDGTDGTDGDDAPQIDDTQASAEHPWSGSKINSELTDVKDAIDRLDENKLDIPTGTPVVGKTAKIKTVNEDGTFVCEWADGGGAVEDVQINGTSVVGTDCIAVLPLARANNVYGLVGLSTQNASGMYVPYDGAYLRLTSPDATRLANRTTEINHNLPVLLKNLNASVIAALTDDNHITLTSARQATARSVIFTAPSTVTIAAASWSSQSVTVSVTGVTATGTIMLTPSTKADADTIGACGIWCTAQADGALTFTCTSTPTSAVSYNVMLF